MTLLLAAALLTGNTRYAQAAQEQSADIITESVVSENAFASQAADKQQSKAVVQAKSKKQDKNAAYNKKAKKAYKKFLKDYYVQGKSFHYGWQQFKWSDYKSSRKYSIYDINHDGKLELLIDNSGRPESYLFSYYKGKVKCVAVAGYHSCFYECKKGKVIVMSSANNGSEGTNLYLLQKGTLKYLGGMFIENKYTGTGRMKNGKIMNEWSFNDAKNGSISKAKFKKILKKYTGSTDVKAFSGCIKDGKAYFKELKKVKTQLKELKYKTYKIPTIKPVTGIKVNHKLNYTIDNNYGYKTEWVNDFCKITWDKSVAGNVQITYATDKYFSDKKTKTVKASEKKNYCVLKDLYGGTTYYIKLRTYVGDKCAYSKYSKVHKITMKNYQPGVDKEGNTLYYTYKKKEKYYICQKDLTTNDETKIISSDNWLRLQCIEGIYMYYTTGNDKKTGHESDLYVYKMDTKQKKFMLNQVCTVGEIAFGKVFCQQDLYLMDYEEADLYTFDLDGTNKKKVLENIISYFTYDNQIYWCDAEFAEDGGVYYILRSCDLNGKNKTDVTEWIYTEYIEDVYFSKEYAIENYIQ